MSIAFIGDAHGDIHTLRELVKETEQYPNIVCCIQVGDFGCSIKTINELKLNGFQFAKPTYFILGNHEYFDDYDQFKEVTELLPNLFYVPSGTVLKLDNRIVAFMSGAASIDKIFQIQQGTWSEKENITPEQIFLLEENIKKIGNPDIFVTHTPPKSVVDENFDPMEKLWFGVPITWQDVNAEIIERLWKRYDYPFNISGHFHKSRMGQFYKVLSILELYTY